MGAYCVHFNNPGTCPICEKDGRFTARKEAQSTIASLQVQLAERDQVILEQQARIAGLEAKNATFVDMVLEGDDLALEAALKAERIKTLEDIANNFEQWSTSYCGVVQERIFSSYSTELRRMVNELKK